MNMNLSALYYRVAMHVDITVNNSYKINMNKDTNLYINCIYGFDSKNHIKDR